MFEGASYNTFTNVKSKCYIGSKLDSTFDDSGNEIKNYDTPAEYSFNIQPVNSLTTSASEIESFGENANKMKVAVITNRKKYENKFKEFDCAYLDGVTPEGESVNGQNANYRIYAVYNQNVVIRVFFLKIV